MNESITLDTGLAYRGTPVEVTIEPDKDGGMLIFKCGMKRRRLPLATILANVVEGKPTGTTPEDLVDLRELEPRLSVMCLDADTDEDERARHGAKVATLRLVRDMRDERRKKAGLPPVRWALGSMTDPGE